MKRLSKRQKASLIRLLKLLAPELKSLLKKGQP